MNPDITEAEYQRLICDHAHAYGWQTMHVRPARSGRRTLTPTSIAGWPDLVLWRPGALWFAEIKKTGGKLSPTQEQVIASLQATGSTVHVWWPSNWAEVQALLTHPTKDPT